LFTKAGDIEGWDLRGSIYQGRRYRGVEFERLYLPRQEI
jgi:hypothetical protein